MKLFQNYVRLDDGGASSKSGRVGMRAKRAKNLDPTTIYRVMGGVKKNIGWVIVLSRPLSKCLLKSKLT